LLLTALSIVVLVITRLVTGPGSRNDVTTGAARPPRRSPLGRLRMPVVVASLAVPAVAVGPTVFMTVRGLVDADRDVPVGWVQVGGALWTTLGYAVAAALIATAAAFPVSLWVNRRRTLAPIVTERAVWVAHAIPSAILALSLVFLATRLVPALYKTPAVLIAAYVILFLPLAVANQQVGLEATRRSYEDVAASLGARPSWTFLRVNLPLALPGFLAGALLVGLDASKELTTTLMLVPYNTHTLSTRLWATTNGESLDFTAAAPYAAMLVLLGIPPVYLLVRHALRSLDVTRSRTRTAVRFARTRPQPGPASA
jgi:iron(III) transport system permease protein